MTPLPEVPARWACLRVEHAALYPGLDAAVWYPAQSVADYFKAWLLRHPGGSGSGADPIAGDGTFRLPGRCSPRSTLNRGHGCRDAGTRRSTAVRWTTHLRRWH